MTLSHIGIEVNDLYRMELFYRKHLGFEKVYHYVSLNTKDLRTVFLKKGSLYLELLERHGNLSFGSVKKPSFHISLEVPDVDLEYEHFKVSGNSVLKPPRNTGDGFREMELIDPEGNVIEISKRINPPPQYKVRGIIFDLDGTLIDSEDNYYESDRILLSKYGIDFAQKDKADYIGYGGLEMMTEIKKRYNIKDSVQTLIDKKNEIYLEIALENTKVFPEMLRFLDILKKDGFPLAVASGSSRIVLDKLIEKTGLINYFDVMISAEFVESGKPSPAIFFETAKRMELKPENCLVVEDSRFGVEAAKRAFMYCIAIPYLDGKPIDGSFMMADLLFENGMNEFSAEKAFSWLKALQAPFDSGKANS